MPALAAPAGATAPDNDYFANATAINALPFTDTVDQAEATSEPDENFPCGTNDRTAWWSFTPTEDQIVRVSGPRTGTPPSRSSGRWPPASRGSSC